MPNDTPPPPDCYVDHDHLQRWVNYIGTAATRLENQAWGESQAVVLAWGFALLARTVLVGATMIAAAIRK